MNSYEAVGVTVRDEVITDCVTVLAPVKYFIILLNIEIGGCERIRTSGPTFAGLLLSKQVP